MSKLVGWKIYYDDESVFSSLDGGWKDAPSDGVQVVVEYYEDGTKKLHFERDYYIFDEEKAFDTNDLNPYLRKWGMVKFGRWSSDDKFQELVKKAKNDVFNSGSENEK